MRNRNRIALFALSVVLCIVAIARAGNVLIGTQPFADKPLRFGVDIYPAALGFKRNDDISYWHGLTTGIRVDHSTRYASVGYGVSFLGQNSGTFFISPLLDLKRRTAGFVIDITYYFFAFPIKLSLLNISSERTSNMLFTANLSAGIGIPSPLVRIEKGRLRTILD